MTESRTDDEILQGRCAACGGGKIAKSPWKGVISRWCQPCLDRIRVKTPWWRPDIPLSDHWKYTERTCHYCGRKFVPVLRGDLMCPDCVPLHCFRCGKGVVGKDLACGKCGDVLQREFEERDREFEERKKCKRRNP